jgi:hypothetical protein
MRKLTKLMKDAAQQIACTPTVQRWFVESERLLVAGEAERSAA